MRILAAAFLLFSFSAVAACPNLSGTYAVCRSTTGAMSGSTDMVVSQKIVNRVTYYTITSTDAESHERDTVEYPADGKTYSETTNDPQYGELTASINFKCSGNAVVGFEGLTVEGQTLMDLNSQVTKSGNTLTTAYQGTIFGMPYEDVLICE